MSETTERAVHRRPSRHVEINTDTMRATRVRLGLTHRSLARAISSRGFEITSARIGQIEHGQGSPSPELFPLLCRALGLKQDELRR